MNERSAPAGDRSDDELSPRSTQAVVSFVLLVVLAAVAAFIPVPFVALAPGPTFNTIGSYSGTPLVTIAKQTTYPTTGHLDLVTIRETGGPQGGLDLLTAIRGWFDPHVEVVPRSVLFPPDATAQQVRQEHKEQFADSQGEAVAAAMAYLKIPTKTRVVAGTVSVDGPSAKLIDPGDEIVSINSKVVATPSDVLTTIRPLPIGSKVTVLVRTGTAKRTVSVTTREHPAHPGRSYIGVGVGTVATPPFPVTFELSSVGGPSAGMMFALGLIDKLTPGPMTGGLFIAGTGTIDTRGNVGPIGGIAQKMVGAQRSGATVFLAPAENCDEVVGHIPKGMTVVKVSTLTEAVTAVTKAGQGHLTGLPSCSVARS
ncbi:MAG: PDZ domain-containing protein [Actinobacteria bacterium]|nr:PDZ domain-containing protein [Actinomycetota bacterium]